MIEGLIERTTNVDYTCTLTTDSIFNKTWNFCFVISEKNQHIPDSSATTTATVDIENGNQHHNNIFGVLH